MSTDPTIEQLAALAVAFNREGRLSPAAAAELALQHWHAAEWTLHEAQARAEATAKEREQTAAAQAPLRAALRAVRRPTKFPVRLDEALRCWLPNRLAGRTGEAYALYREHLAANMRFDSWKRQGIDQGMPFDQWPEPPADEVAGQFALDRRTPFREREFWLTAESFLAWFVHRHTAEVALARAAAGRRGGRPRKKEAAQGTAKKEAHRKQ